MNKVSSTEPRKNSTDGWQLRDQNIDDYKLIVCHDFRVFRRNSKKAIDKIREMGNV